MATKSMEVSQFLAGAVANADEIGISVSGIAKIQDALDSYKAAIKAKIDVSATTSMIQAAIKGTNSVAMFNAATKELNTTLQGLLAYIDNFKNYLNQVEGQYKKHDSSVNYSFNK